MSKFVVTCSACGQKVKAQAGSTLVCPKCQAEIRVRARPPAPDAPAPAAPESPVKTRLQIPRRRWLLMVSGLGLVVLVSCTIGLLVFGRPAPLPVAEETSPIDKLTPARELAQEPRTEAPANANPSDEPAERTRPKRKRILFDEDIAAAKSRTTPSHAVGSPTDAAGSGRRAVWTQAPWGVPLGEGASPLLNGSPFVPALLASRARVGVLVLPTGEHLWQSDSQSVPETRKVSSAFFDFYSERCKAMQTGGKWNFEKLATATRPTAGLGDDPLLPHLWGNYYWQEEQPEAAVRLWKQAVRAEPAFGPSHLNLAYAYVQAGQKPAAMAELALAAHCNLLDAWGLDAHLQELRQRLGVWEATAIEPVWNESAYRPATSPLPAEPLKVVRVLHTTALYMTHWQDRAAAYNNAGVYLIHRDLPEHAIEPLQDAVGILVENGGIQTEKSLLSTVFDNLQRAAQKARMPEQKLYVWLRDAYR